MAFDGVVIASIIHELKDKILGGRIGKVNQPEKDELILTIRHNRVNHKLLLSSMASMPKLHLTQTNKTNPITAPNFCMLLRKHLVGGVIKSISQPNFERIVEFEIENFDELGVLVTRRLIIEIMGRHSNIILTSEDHMIMDAVRRVGAQISSVREVFPNRAYVLPPNQDKVDPTQIEDISDFIACLKKDMPIQKSLYTSITGLSPQIAEALCYDSQINGSDDLSILKDDQLMTLHASFEGLTNAIEYGDYDPIIYVTEDGAQKAFTVIPLNFLTDLEAVPYDSPSEMVENYYLQNAIRSRISQKSVDLRKLVNTNLERCYKKLNIQHQQIQDTGDRDKFKIRGELINSNIYKIKEGDTSVTVLDYYNDNKEITIALDPQLSPSKNSQKQYNKYNKKKRTLEALSGHIQTTKQELDHLESVKYALEHALKEEDLLEIREELMATGYIKFRRSKAKKALKKAESMHYLSSDGFHIYVGKNNLQNEYLTTKFANGGDWWFHAKGIPGSHVIVKTQGMKMEEIPDRLYEEAAGLAAYYSKDKNSAKVSVDYLQKKHLKKPNGTAPGYVIYHTNYSMMATPSIEGLEEVNE